MSYDAILLTSFGGPESLEEVMPFLERVTAGRGIPRERLEEVSRFLDRRAETRILSLRSAQSRSLKAAFSGCN